MALSKVNYNSLNVTAAASKALKWNSTPNGFETGDVGGSLVLLATETASSSATITFDSNIDSTYKEYIFKFFNIHPQTDNKDFGVNFRDGSTAYDTTITTSYFHSVHDEADTSTSLAYITGHDEAQTTDPALLSEGISSDADHGSSGYVHLFDPSSTTFVKHFICRSNGTRHGNQTSDVFVAGYCNVTAAIDGVQFKMSSGNIDDGVIKMYGVS